MNSRICDVIRDRKIIRFSYSGGFRKVEPFCHGINTAGNDVLRGWQIDGYSESGNPQGWKLFRVDTISRLTITDEVFEGRRPGYNPNDSAMATVYCHV
jgi:predicted DNA-binding transcriptional regulator YafY